MAKPTTSPLTLDALNAASETDAAAMLSGIYEHSPWVTAAALKSRPFATLAALKQALVQTVSAAGPEAALKLLRAHPELAGKAMVAKTMTTESTGEQSSAGLDKCSPEEFADLQRLNAEYNRKFSFPFILAVRGPRGVGLNRTAIIETFRRRLDNHPDFERDECLRNVHRVAELRLNERFGYEPMIGNRIWDDHEDLARFSDPGFAERGQLTVTYLTDAHRQAARMIADKMTRAGFDDVGIDAVGNVVGIYHGANKNLPRLMTGSHYDTVRNGGKYDGRLGIFTPMACVAELARTSRRLPFGIELVAFSEEEGQRYKATFLGSGALTGDFNSAWLDQRDADGVLLRDAMVKAGLDITKIPSIKRDPARYLGFVEVHIEQGPVLNELGLPLGVVTSINGSVRFACEMIGMASHAGTTPMDRRRDAASGVAELALFLEKRAARDRTSVGTIGMLEVPNGSINVVPGRCRFSLDLRAPTDAQRDALVADTLAELEAICSRRGLRHTREETMRASAAPSDPKWMLRWQKAVKALGLPAFDMPSGAGHDAMKLHDIMPQAMLFVRGENSGISHNPLESTTSDDMDLAAQAFMHLLDQLEQDFK